MTSREPIVRPGRVSSPGKGDGTATAARRRGRAPELPGVVRRVDDQHVAVRVLGDALADAAAEHALEEARLAGADDDQPRLPLRGDVDELARRLADDPRELVVDSRRREERLGLLAMLLPDRLLGVL